MNRSKTKGSAAERDIVNYLRTVGWPHAERRLAGSTKDRGDVAGVIGVVIEAKDCRGDQLPGWLDEAHLEAANDRADLGVVWHKRRGRSSPADWFVTMSGADFTTLLAAAGYGGQPPTARSAGATQERTNARRSGEAASQNPAASGGTQ